MANPFLFERYLAEVKLNASALNDDSALLSAFIKRIVRGIDASDMPVVSNEQLYQIFSASTALGFALWQHLAGVERLHFNQEWRQTHAEKFSEYMHGKRLIGLATTHLGNPQPPLIGLDEGNQFRVSGFVPWCTGHSIFHDLLLGFETETESVVVLTAFPSSECPDTAIEVIPIELAALNSTSTFSMRIRNLSVSKSQIVSRRHKSVESRGYVSFYRQPDLGMAWGALQAVEKQVEGSNHPKHQFARATAASLSQQLRELKEIADDPSIPLTDENELAKAKLIYASVKLLTLVLGSAALRKGSEGSRRLLEALLIDSTAQSRSLIETKMNSLAMNPTLGRNN